MFPPAARPNTLPQLLDLRHPGLASGEDVAAPTPVQRDLAHRIAQVGSRDHMPREEVGNSIRLKPSASGFLAMG